MSAAQEPTCGRRPAPLLQAALGHQFTRSERKLRFQAIDRIARNLNPSCVSARIVEERCELALLNIEIQAKPLNFIQLHKAENNSGLLVGGMERNLIS
jgi:hypothetical protein